MELTCENVEKVFMDCLFGNTEDKSDAILVDGIVAKYGFNPSKIELHKEEIRAMLSELPDSFKPNSGGGMSFLNACMTKANHQWGEHRNMEQLFSLGIAAGFVTYCMPREMWNILPGGVPYLTVNV